MKFEIIGFYGESRITSVNACCLNDILEKFRSVIHYCHTTQVKIELKDCQHIPALMAIIDNVYGADHKIPIIVVKKI